MVEFEVWGRGLGFVCVGCILFYRIGCVFVVLRIGGEVGLFFFSVLEMK